MLAGWADILPEAFTMWLVNRFADVFIIAEDGSVHHLDIAGGTLLCAAARAGRGRRNYPGVQLGQIGPE